jgi:HD domain
MDLESIQKTARSDLLLSVDDGAPDVFLWEHSLRVARNARQVAHLAEARALGVDELSAFVAGLYHDAGWASRVNAGELDRMHVLLGPTTEGDCEAGALMLERSLRGRVSPMVLDRAATAVRTRLDRSSRSPDAVVLAEAEALDEFGVLPLWLAVRRGALEGRGVEAAIESWVRKKEYSFWTARLTDSFRFSEVRELARMRLTRIERLMGEVQLESLGQDLAAVVGGVPREAATDGLAT